MGISQSTVPTLYGPVYAGNDGVGFRCESRDVMLRVSGEVILCDRYYSVLRSGFSCSIMYILKRNENMNRTWKARTMSRNQRP